MGILGLIFNFFGALIIAFSVRENPGDAHQEYKFLFWNIKLKLASINIFIFWGGFFVLCVGFIFQIVSKFI